jgi:transposase InsO family protein
MIDRSHDLPLVRQAELLRLGRGRLYYEPRPVSSAELAIMRRIDECISTIRSRAAGCYTNCIRGEGIAVGRELVVTMMRCRRIEAPNASKPADGHKIYPCLLRGPAVERPNQIWAMDITYIPMARGFVYLAAVVDWFSRRVLAWRLSIPMETSTTCRGSRQHECAAVVWASLRSGYASRGAPTTAMLQYQPAEAPLIEGETLSRRSQPPLSKDSVSAIPPICPAKRGGFSYWVRYTVVVVGGAA